MKESLTPPQEESAVPAEFSSSSLSDDELLPLPSPHRNKKKLLIVLSIVALAFALLLGYIFTSRYATLYARTIRDIGFDYREGEQSTDTLLPTDTSTAESIASQLDGKSVSISAVSMLFNDTGGYSPTLTLYDYHKSSTESALTMRTCAELWLPTEVTSLRQDANGVYTQSGDGWVMDDSLRLIDLYAYCFDVSTYEGFSLYQRYNSMVGDQIYLCEIWLMEDHSGKETVYNTLYRYYDGDTLCAVRLLPSHSTDMLVFDISDYHAE